MNMCNRMKSFVHLITRGSLVLFEQSTATGQAVLEEFEATEVRSSF